MSELSEDPRVTELREHLNAHFRQMAAAAQIELRPVTWDRRVTILVRRLYEERIGNRLFIASPQNRAGLDAFTKQTGLDYEVTLLQVNTELTETYFPILWRAYLAWMHKGVDENEVLSILQSG